MPTEHNPETGSTSLRRMILGQSLEGTAIPMTLFSDATLDGAGEDGEHPEAVVRAAAGLGIDLDTLGLFSYDAYRLQAVLGGWPAP